MERAEALIELNRRSEAADVARRALTQHPDDPELLDVLSLAQLSIDAAASLDAAERLIAVSPEGHRGHLLAALACDELRRKDEAERHARAAVEAAPWLPVSHVVLSDVLVGRRGRREQALRAARTAIELDPESSMGYVSAGNVELAYGNWTAGEAWYRRALEVDPADTTAQTNLAHARKAQDKLRPAVLEAGSLLRLDPHDEGARRVLDEVVYSSLVHLLWVALAVSLVVTAVRSLY